MCSKFEVQKRRQGHHGCDFVVNQLSPEDHRGIEKSICSALFFQGGVWGGSGVDVMVTMFTIFRIK
jgi:hypothetical protein